VQRGTFTFTEWWILFNCFRHDRKLFGFKAWKNAPHTSNINQARSSICRLPQRAASSNTVDRNVSDPEMMVKKMSVAISTPLKSPKACNATNRGFVAIRYY